MYTYACSTLCCWVFCVSVLVFDLLVHVAPAGAPAWAMRLCQGIHVIFLPSFRGHFGAGLLPVGAVAHAFTRRSIVHIFAVLEPAPIVYT